MEKSPETQYKVRFIDCDPLHHLTNSRFIDYMLNAREDHVNQFYNLDYFEYSKQTGNAWVAYENRITYLKEATYNEKVTIVSQVINIQETSAVVEVVMYNEKKTKVYAVLWTTIVHINVFQKKREPHSEKILELFHKVLVPIPENNYEERIMYYKNSNKVSA